MQNLARDEDGVVWELDAAGNPVRPVEAAPAPSQGRVFSLPQNPREVRQEARQERQDARADARDERAADDRTADNARADREFALRSQTAGLEAELKRLQIAKAGDTGAGGKGVGDRVSRLNQLVRQINRVQTLFDTNIGQTTGLAGLQDYAPTNENARFDAAGAALSQQGLAAFRVPGTGTVSDRDAIMFDRANLPTAATRDAAIDEQLLGLRSRVEEELRSLNQSAPNWGSAQDAAAGKAEQRADNEVPDPTTGAALKPGPEDDNGPPDLPPANMPGGNEPTMAVATGSSRLERNTRLSSQVDAMMNAGASEATINAVLKQQGYPTMQLGHVARAKAWMKQNPGQRYTGADVTRDVPLTMLEKVSASAPAAFISQAADAFTGGTIGALAGERGQGALDAMSALHPKSSLGGSVLGGVTGALGAEAALAARAPAALARYAPRIADALFGGLSGFNAADEGEGLQGAATGAILAPLMGSIGQRAVSGIGRGVRGVSDPAVQYLRGLGIPTTVGQTVANSGRVGGAIKNVEDAFTSIPGPGGAVNARRLEGLEGFNQAMYRELPGHSGQTGSAGVQEAGQIAGDAFNFLDNTQLPIDAPYAGTEAMIRATAPARYADDINDQLDMTSERATTGVLGGRDWQSAVRANRSNRSSLGGQPYADRAMDTHGQIDDNLMDLAVRQGPAGATENLGTANSNWARYQTILKALDNGPAQQAGELVTPARLDAAARQGANNFGGRAASMAGERPFYDLTTAGRAVLPSSVPDSGTATRGLVANGILGGIGAVGGGAVGSIGGEPGAGAATGLGAALALALGGSRPAQRMLTSALADRPDFAVILGEAIRNQARLGGGAGAGASTAVLAGN